MADSFFYEKTRMFGVLSEMTITIYENIGWKTVGCMLLLFSCIALADDDGIFSVNLDNYESVMKAGIDRVCGRKDTPAWYRRELQNLEITARDSSCLCAAAAIGDLSLVNFLLSQDDGEVEVNAVVEHDLTPLILASIYGNEKIVRMLLDAGAKINAADKGGRTALSWAVGRDRSAVVKELLTIGRKKHPQSRWVKSIRKLKMARVNHMMSRFDRQRIQINLADEKGCTPLYYGARCGSAASVEMLWKAGADINIRNLEGETPLMAAVDGDRLETVMQLIRYKAGLNAEDAGGRTALMRAVALKQERMVELLLGAGADVNHQDGSGRTALMDSVDMGNAAFFDQLLAAGAKVNLRSGNGWTALMYAAWGDHIGMLRKLLAGGADPNAKNKDGLTAVLLAASRGHMKSVSWLFSEGAEMLVSPDNFFTTMLMACRSHYALLDDFRKDPSANGRGYPFADISRHLGCSEGHMSGNIQHLASHGLERVNFQKNNAAGYFVDSAQELTECIFLIANTGDFNLVEKKILSNVIIGRIPVELKPILQSILELCQKGRKQMLETQKQRKKYVNTALENLAQNSSSVCGRIVGGDVIGALMTGGRSFYDVYKGYQEYSKVEDAVRLEWEEVLKNLMFQLRSIITENETKYGVELSRIIVFETLKDFQTQFARSSGNPVVLENFCQRYPYYVKFHQYAISYGSGQWWPMFVRLMSTRNTILLEDSYRKQVCKVIGDRVIALLMASSENMPEDLRKFWLTVLKAAANYGLQSGGHVDPYFYFMRGVAKAEEACFGFEKNSERSIWNDLSYRDQEKNDLFIPLQAFWCSAWLGMTMNRRDSEKYRECLRIGLKYWSPFFMNNCAPFPKNKIAEKIFRESLKISYDWHVKWGLMSDDIVLKNTSLFPLSQIRCKVRLIRKQTGKCEFSKELYCPRLNAGDSFSWEKIMSIHDGSDETMEKTLELSCDEDALQ